MLLRAHNVRMSLLCSCTEVFVVPMCALSPVAFAKLVQVVSSPLSFETWGWGIQKRGCNLRIRWSVVTLMHG